MKALVLILLCLVQLTAANAWELTEDERQALCSSAICYSINRRGHLSSRIGDMDIGDFDKLEILAMRDRNGCPDLPYRYRLYNADYVRESVQYSPDERTWDSLPEMLMVDRGPMGEFKWPADVHDEQKAVEDGIVDIRENNGSIDVRVNEIVRIITNHNVMTGFHVSEDSVDPRHQWYEYANGLHLKCARTQTLRENIRSVFGKLRALLFGRVEQGRYVCAWALYQKEDSDQGWVCRGEDEIFPYIIKLRIWRVGDEMTRKNAVCVAQYSGEISVDSMGTLAAESEKGGDQLEGCLEQGQFGKFSRKLRVRFDGCEMAVSFGSRMTAEELQKREQEFKEDVRRRMGM